MVKALFSYRGLVVLIALLAAMPGMSFGTFIGGAEPVPSCDTLTIQAAACKAGNYGQQAQICFGCPDHKDANITIICTQHGNACVGNVLVCTPGQFNHVDGGDCIVQNCAGK